MSHVIMIFIHPELTYWRQVELVLPWMISTAADAIARKEKEGLFLTSPFLLIFWNILVIFYYAQVRA
ncbi:unnamed protein product, partial [Vitis vinifera]